MRYNAKADEDVEIVSLRQSLETLIAGLGYSLIEMVVSKHRGSVQIRAVIYEGLRSASDKSIGVAAIGVDDCSKVHRTIMPRLELAFEGQEIYLEVSSPGIERLIKDGKEFAHYKGKGVRCYRTDISDWTAGILNSADEKGIELITKDGSLTTLSFDIIAKAKLDSAAGSGQSIRQEG